MVKVNSSFIKVKCLISYIVLSLTIWVSVFKLFIFTVVKNLALNKKTHGPDLP